MLASLGATIPARRTALGHILFNVLAGAIAFGAAPWFLEAVHWMLSPDAPDIIRVALFHTLFNVVGAALMLPAVPLLARAVRRLVPEREPSLTRHLDKSLLSVPAAALDASADVLCRMAALLFEGTARNHAALERQLPELRAGVTRTLEFMAQVPHTAGSPRDRTNLSHACDHLTRLIRALRGIPSGALGHGALEDGSHGRVATNDTAADLTAALHTAAARLDACSAVPADVATALEQISRRVAAWRAETRVRLLDAVSVGEMPASRAEGVLKRIAWMDRVGYHAWRAAAHLAAWAAPASQVPAEPADDPVPAESLVS